MKYHGYLNFGILQFCLHAKHILTLWRPRFSNKCFNSPVSPFINGLATFSFPSPLADWFTLLKVLQQENKWILTNSVDKDFYVFIRVKWYPESGKTWDDMIIFNQTSWSISGKDIFAIIVWFSIHVVEVLIVSMLSKSLNSRWLC